MRPHARILLGGLVALMGCYHATIDTGVAPSEKVIEKKWTSGWIGGLVPPSTTTTAAQCPTGVAKVETKLSFLNGVVSLVTMSIYTPMAIRVTCAGAAAPAAGVELGDAGQRIAQEYHEIGHRTRGDHADCAARHRDGGEGGSGGLPAG